MKGQQRMTRKLWGGRFREETDALVNRFNASIGFDWRLFSQDIQGSIAHCRMLARQGIIPEEEGLRIIEALGEIRREMESGEIHFDEQYEDIHSLIEGTLIERLGAAGEKIHTARSRNDQVAVDIRLYLRDVIERISRLIEATQAALVELAEDNSALLMPGYTHLQRAQPVLLAHHLLAYYEMLKRDRQRLQESRKRVNVLPLGSAALAGSTFSLDREMVAEELGFDRISENSMDAVGDRDFVVEFLADAAMLMMHLSRFSEELVIWSTQEFGFVSIADAFCTGSSIMPQKKNPDVPELIRGKSGRVYGHLMSLLTTMKGLPLTYNKDMQEDKEALFDAADTVENCLAVTSRLLKNIHFNEDRLQNAVRSGYLVATDLAEYLVGKGIPFREAHAVVGKLVLSAQERQKELHEMKLSELKHFCSRIEADVYDWLDPESSIRKRNLPGGTGTETVQECIRKAKQELGF
jgi:argininosuccinate lyase